MHQSTDTHRTAKDLSPEELAQYRQRLHQHLQNRKVDEALLHRAWDTAHRIAAASIKTSEQLRLPSLDRSQNQRHSQNGRISTSLSGASQMTSIFVHHPWHPTSAAYLRWIWLILKVVKGYFAREFRVN